jgi:hypothetical protein
MTEFGVGGARHTRDLVSLIDQELDCARMTAYPSLTFSKGAFGAELRSTQKSSGSVADYTFPIHATHFQ